MALYSITWYLLSYINREWGFNLPLLLIEGCCIDLGPPFAAVLLTPPLHGDVGHGAVSTFTTAVMGGGATTLDTVLTTFCCCWGRILVVTSATWRHGVELPPELLTGSFLICTKPPFGHSETELPLPPAFKGSCNVNKWRLVSKHRHNVTSALQCGASHHFVLNT